MIFLKIILMRLMKCLVFSAVIIFNSCTQKKDELKGFAIKDYKKNSFINFKLKQDSLIVLNVPLRSEYLKNKIPLSKLVDSSFSIVLETTNRNLIGKIDDVKIFENKIFVLDSRKAEAIFVFDMKGHYLRQIGETGRGPQEYPYPQDFSIDEDFKEILVFNGSIRKIFRYNLDGDFLGEIKVPIDCYAIKTLEAGNIILFAGNYMNEHLSELKNRLFYVINKKGDIISYGPTVSSDFINIDASLLNKSLVKNKQISYSYKFSDTIYSIKNEEYVADFFINFGKDSFNREKFKLMNNRSFIKERVNFPSFIGTHLQTKNYLYFYFSYKNIVIHCYYNKIQDKLYVGSSLNLHHLDYPMINVPISTFKDYFISAMDSSHFIETKETISKITNNNLNKNYNKYISMNKNLSNLNLKESDNPILFFYKLKSIK